MKILKNTTGSVIELDVLGISIPASGQREIEETDFLLLADDDGITEITPLINSGDIVVNNGLIDLIAADGIRYCRFAERATIENDGIDVTQVNTIINFDAGVTATNNGNGKVTITTNAGEGDDDRLISIKCLVDGSCDPTVEACLLVDQTLCFIKTEDC